MSTKIEISKVQMSPRSPTPLNIQPAEFQVRSGAPAEPADYLPVMGGGDLRLTDNLLRPDRGQ